MGQLTAEAEKTDVVLAHENESGIYGDTGQRCLDLVTSLDSASFGCIFDFANFVNDGEDVWHCWELLRDHLTYFHIKDMTRNPKKIVPAGQGDGDVARILKDAFARGFDGYLSLEPHLKEEFGATGAERFKASADGLKAVLAAVGHSV